MIRSFANLQFFFVRKNYLNKIDKLVDEIDDEVYITPVSIQTQKKNNEIINKQIIKTQIKLLRLKDL